MIKKFLSFDDVLLTPNFSEVKSRKDVSLYTYGLGLNLDLPIISSNMDTVTEETMANVMVENGAIGAIHRFMDIDKNVEMFKKCPSTTIVSVGLNNLELERAEALHASGASRFLIDVAHGASMEVVRQYNMLRGLLHSDCIIIVGNFATAQSIKDFQYQAINDPDAYKIGIGGGSACLTRIVTGCGLPTFGSIQDCATTGEVLIADGGMRNSGDISKALAAGATYVMLGKMLAGTDESPSEVIFSNNYGYYDGPAWKKYRGSASESSYEKQGKIASHRAPEGDSFLVSYVGPVKGVLEDISAGIRSACSYVGAHNLDEFRERATFVEITHAGAKESEAHGKL